MPDISALNGTAIDSVAEFDGLTVTAAVAFTGLLDTYTGAAAGYSTRRLASSATVLMRVRRETAGGTGDDDEADVAYDSNNELSLDSAISNASALVTATTLGQFLNVGTVNGTTYTNPDSLTVTASCFVDEWKDQSGNANHATQGTPSNQPQIHSGTVNTDLITSNGKPIMDRDSNGIMTLPMNTQGYKMFAVFETNGNSIMIAQAGNYFLVSQSGSGTSPIYSSAFTVNSYRHNGSSATLPSTWGAAYTEYSSQNLSYWDVDMPSGNIQLGFQIGANYSMYSMQELIMYPDTVTPNETGIETNINTEYLIYQPTDQPTSGLLYDYGSATGGTDAAAAYSVRQLSDKAVIALRIRRDMGTGSPGDDDETNIGFDANGDLDTQAIADFCTTGTGYVTRWWDQSTNGNHLDQPVGGTGSNALQPQIYNGTAVITENGKPAAGLNVDVFYFWCGSILAEGWPIWRFHI